MCKISDSIRTRVYNTHPHCTLYAAFGWFMFSYSRPTIEIVQNSMLGICCLTCTLRRAAFAWKTAFSATPYVKVETMLLLGGPLLNTGSVNQWNLTPALPAAVATGNVGKWVVTSSPRNVISCHPHVTTALSFWWRICNPTCSIDASWKYGFSNLIFSYLFCFVICSEKLKY